MNKQPLGLLALLILAGCGGGNPPDAAVTPAAATAALRAKILAASDAAVAPEEAARQLMDFAESSAYRIYFPSHEPTQVSGAFQYRYYPATNIYLGVVVLPGTSLAYGGVYVMGGPFGNVPLYVGQLTAFITPVSPGGVAIGANNGCFDLALGDTPGTHAVIAYSYAGTTNGTATVDWTVGALTRFEDNDAYETLVKTISNTTGVGGSTATAEIKTYGRRTGDITQTNYGSSSTASISIGGVAGTVTTTSVYTPPFADRTAGLQLGFSVSQTSTLVTTSTTVLPPPVPAFPPTLNTSTTTTVSTFEAIESVSVPAGTYQACKFVLTYPSAPSLTTSQWVIRGKGIPVKIVSTAPGQTDTVQQATSVTLNGSKL
ncbi:MAG: hypothetical protein HY021_16665 [Burkholderiales bacterium]|nr:hypothetical protein [Burkholderiales bacterium]